MKLEYFFITFDLPCIAFEVELVKYFYRTEWITQHIKFFRYLEKKKKHKKGNEEENFDFPGQEKIKFGDIVQAPPKFSVTPKVSAWNP